MTGLEWVAEVMSLGLLFSGIAYGVWVTWVGGGLDRLPGGESNDRPSLNVIIPARDEQNDLPRTLESISTQNYPAEQMQVILVNDRSIDDTPEIMRSWASEQQFEVTVLDITETSADMAPKKHAVQQAMTLAKGEIIVTTDADTKHDSEWLSTVATHFAPEVGMVIGLTVRQKTPGRLSFWQKADIADFLSHAIMSAGAVGRGTAYTAIGSNLAYRKKVFDEVGGFSTEIGKLVSGDDDLLVQRVSTHTDWQLRFPTEPKTFVQTTAPPDLRGMLNQRVRWASKGSSYRKSLVWMLTTTFTFYSLLALSLPLSLTGWSFAPSVSVAFGAWAFKLFIDTRLMWKGCSTLEQRAVFKHVWFAQMIHIPMILYAAMAGHMGTFTWKGTRHSRTVGK